MENMGFGLNVTLIGMGLVFALLALLWLVLYLIGNIDSLPFLKGGDEEEAPDEELAEGEGAGEADALAHHEGEVDPDLLAAITIAVAAHVAVKRRQAAPSMRKTVPGSQIFASRWVAAGRTRQTDSWTHKG